MGSLAERKTLMRCIKQLYEKAVVDQRYRSSERGKAGMFPLQQVFSDSFLLGITSWLTWDRSRTGVLHKKIATAIG